MNLTPEEFEQAARDSADIEVSTAELEGRTPNPSAVRVLKSPKGEIAAFRRNHEANGTLFGRYLLFWSNADNEYVATHSGMPSLSWLDPDPVEAVRGLRKIIESDPLVEKRIETDPIT